MCNARMECDATDGEVVTKVPVYLGSCRTVVVYVSITVQCTGASLLMVRLVYNESDQSSGHQ